MEQMHPALVEGVAVEEVLEQPLGMRVEPPTRTLS